MDPLEWVTSINVIWALTDYLEVTWEMVPLSSVRLQFSHYIKIKIQFINYGNQFKQTNLNSII